MKMKTAVLTIFLVFILMLSCKKDCPMKSSDNLTNAIITGNDLRACACCGGLMITFSNDAITYSSPFYDIDQMPSNSGIDEKSTFPIYVKVKYTSSTNTCGNHINISQLVKR
jgi:hypothetical protein